MPGMFSALISSIVFSVIGLVVFAVSFIVVDKLTPYDLWKEIIENKNVALAIVLGALSFGICTIIAAAIHG